MAEQTVSERLAWARDVAEMTQRELATRAGVSSVCVSTLESGRRQGTNTLTLRKLAVALGVTVGWLAYGEGEPVKGRKKGRDEQQ